MKKNQKMSVIRFATIQLANGDKIRAFHQSNDMCEMHSFQPCDQLVYKDKWLIGYSHKTTKELLSDESAEGIANDIAYYYRKDTNEKVSCIIINDDYMAIKRNGDFDEDNTLSRFFYFNVGDDGYVTSYTKSETDKCRYLAPIQHSLVIGN